MTMIVAIMAMRSRIATPPHANRWRFDWAKRIRSGPLPACVAVTASPISANIEKYDPSISDENACPIKTRMIMPPRRAIRLALTSQSG
ncbi:hypothetical protein ACQ0MK_11885 [Thalassospira lucentensis]|uniref:hypothetical protein n=1 Tax=Thalassospira lucentensis TaxID=168935 RepID=UPI003D2EB22A